MSRALSWCSFLMNQASPPQETGHIFLASLDVVQSRMPHSMRKHTELKLCKTSL